MKDKVLFLVFSFIVIGTTQGQSERFGLYEKLGNTIPNGIQLVSEDSNRYDLDELIDKPTLITFVYYNCPGLCTPMLEGIAEVVQFTETEIGQGYQVLTISIDHEEEWGLAKQKKENYLKTINRKGAKDHWLFFVADSHSIKNLTESLGWEFKRQGNDFVHPSASIMITPSGKISQYFYGTYFNYMHVDMAIAEAWKENTVPTRLKKLKYCFNYDPPKNIATELFTKSMGILIILLAFSLFIYLSVKKPKKDQNLLNEANN